MPSKSSATPAPSTRPALPPRVWLALGVAMLAVSSGSIFARYAQAPALAKAAWRVGLAAALVWPFALWRGRAELRRLGADVWGQATLSGLFLALHFAVWIASLDYTTVAASTLLVNTAPVWVALLAPWLTGDRLRARGWLGIALALGGAALAGAGELAVSRRAFTGDLLALTGALTASFYVMMGRRLRPRVSLLPYLALTYGSATAILWMLVLLTGTRAWGFSAATWGAFFGMALVSQHLGHSCYNYALRYVAPGFLTVTLLSEPILSSLAAWILFGEVPPPRLFLAAALLLPGIWLVASGEASPG